MKTIKLDVDKGPLRSLPPMIALGIVIAKYEAATGQHVTITQADCDAIAGRFVVESWSERDLILTVGSPADG